jgi:hypothetical protein
LHEAESSSLDVPVIMHNNNIVRPRKLQRCPMSELEDYDFQDARAFRPNLRAPTRLTRVWAFAALLVALAGLVAYFALRDRPSVAPASAEGPRPVEATDSKVSPLGTDADPIDLPPLAETDPLVRALLQGLSSHPRVAAWLTTSDLIRNFTSVVHSVADGRTPSAHLGVLRPATRFVLIERSPGAFYVDPQGYARYNGIADAVASVDPAGAARLYTMLKPRIEEAHRELGFPDESFDRPLERAIVSLLQTPVVQGPVALQPLSKGIGYAYADSRLESLNGAQKQLLRMGPRNVEIIEGALRQIALNLGVPPQRLP